MSIVSNVWAGIVKSFARDIALHESNLSTGDCTSLRHMHSSVSRFPGQYREDGKLKRWIITLVWAVFARKISGYPHQDVHLQSSVWLSEAQHGRIPLGIRELVLSEIFQRL